MANTVQEIQGKAWASNLVKWSVGKVSNAILNFSIHFNKHIDLLRKFNINSVDDYFNFSLKFLDTAENKVFTDLGYFYKITQDGADLFFNPHNNLYVVIKQYGGQKVISSFYEITDLNKISGLLDSLNSLLGLLWQTLLAWAKKIVFNFT